MSNLPVTEREITAVCERLLVRLGDGAQLRLEFRTPMRIVDQGQLVHKPRLGPLFRRLLERLDALRGEYAEEPPVAERDRLLDMADSVRLAQDSTRWMDVKSRSRRLGRSTPVGGFVGGASYEAHAEVWKSILPYLLWGQEVHVGKSATKGDGWYRIRMDGR
jgi:CRISPR/Cas system endoribonuclease Cas6 (RAMP superfamily)